LLYRATSQREFIATQGRPTLLTRAAPMQNGLLSQAVLLLWILALSVILAFCFFASSLCITVLLASFLAILVDPLVTRLERLHISRTLSAAIFIFLGTILIGTLTYVSYKQVSEQIDEMPRYAQRIGQAVAPLTKRIEKVRDSAGRLNTEVPTKKVPEVKVKNNLNWTSYIIRGVGPVSGAAIIAGVVPFLMFFLLIQKEALKQKLFIVCGETIDVPTVTTNVTQMVRAFVFGNLLVGSLMALVTAVVLLALKVQGAAVLGAVSGLLNLVPFLGAILASIVPIAAALFQYQSASTFLLIFGTVVCLHTISANLLIPRIIGRRVSVSPVAAIVGILFWGWLWGLIGVLLAVPLTALIKILADAHPSLGMIGNLIAERPAAVFPCESTHR